jgi:predicted phage terminase large subunit-like protein
MGYENAPFHVEWYNYLQNTFSPLKTHPNREKRFLLLWPRGHAKTETTTINYASWLVGNYRDIHINIVTKTASLAEEILTALITRFESDERYRTIFGNLKPQNPKKWTSQELIVARGEISKNPTLKATGLMGPITGGRSDLIICDDIIDEENIRTSLQLEKVNTWFNKVLIPTLYPWGGIIVIGTRWSYADIYAGLLSKWPHDIKQAIQQDGTALWPEYWSLQKLEQRRNEIGTIFFNCQYQNDPTSMQGDLLKSEWLHPWEQQPEPRALKYAGVDPALGEGDLQGIATMSYDSTNKQAYLEDVWAERTSFPAFLQKIQQLHALHRYSKIYIESNAFQKVLTYVNELRGLPIVPTVTAHDKQQRFISMSSHFESKRVLINPFLNRNTEFWLEWVQFPRGQHDDALDAVEIVTRNVIGTPESWAKIVNW